MNSTHSAEFPLAPDIVQLNHASFGIPTLRTLDLADSIRREIDSDSTKRLGAELQARLRSAAGTAAEWLNLTTGELAFTTNATTGAASVINSLPLQRGDRVAVLSTEYPSVTRAWEVRANNAGAACQRVDLGTAVVGTDLLLSELDKQVVGDVTYLQASFVTSSTARVLPLDDLAEWVRSRGGMLIVDAAHGPGHVELAEIPNSADVIFGTLHKWIPTPRPCGFVWASSDWADRIHPAIVSLTWDEVGFSDRFSWLGTFDPTPWLCVPDAIEQWEGWRSLGQLAECERLSALATAELEQRGAVATADPDWRPPRLQACVLPGVTEADLTQALDGVSVRAACGSSPAGAVLRIATHVYNDEADVQRMLAAVDAASSQSRRG